jgi:SAM-dependent methyltransferase
MDPAYAAAYADLYDQHWWWRAREDYLLERLEKQARGRSDFRILDVGCGDALFFDHLSEFGEVRGIEPDARLLSDGKWRSAIHVGTLDDFSAGEPFDWILMLDVLEHIREPLPALQRVRDLADPGASLFVTVPAFESLWTRHDELNRHFARYDQAGLARLLGIAGWEPVDLAYFFHWPAPLKLLVKLKEAILPGEPGVESVPPAPINRAAMTLSRFEQRMFARLRLPFGTSLYARCEVAPS